MTEWETLKTRIQRKSEPDASGCILWTGKCDSQGYGRMLIGGRKGRLIPASRVSLSVKLGRWLGDGEHALHSCDTPSCVNTEHLRVGTNDDNIRDRVQRGRSASGATNGRSLSKLTPTQVLEIRSLLPTKSRKEIAAMYSVTTVCVGDIARGHRWSWL